MDALFAKFIQVFVAVRDRRLLRSRPVSVSQRIAAVDLAPGLQYFGRSIHGTMDMNNDGSVDLAVGSLGAAVLLWLVFTSDKKKHGCQTHKSQSFIQLFICDTFLPFQVTQRCPDIYHRQV